MNPLTKRLHEFLSQDVARKNAATATHQALRERRQWADVEAYLSQVETAPSRAHRALTTPRQADRSKTRAGNAKWR